MRNQHSALPASIAIGLFALVTRCGYGEYPLAPTFCDDWCLALRRVPCDQEPENCVRDCEAHRIPSCALEHEALRACYAASPPQAFVCAGQGFGADVRPLPGVCAGERDALIACGAPEEWQCLTVCREVAAAQPEETAEPAPSAVACPEREIPCDNLCRRLSDGDVKTPKGMVSDVAEARSLLQCAARRGSLCRQGAPGWAEEEQSWQTALLRCAIRGLELP